MNKVEAVHFFLINDGAWNSFATIFVPGLGDVKIDKCLSQATIERVCEEALFALAQKMGVNAAAGMLEIIDDGK